MESEQRLHSLDALRAAALLAGIFLHTTMSFLPGFREVGFPIIDVSSSTALGVMFFVIHVFRMALFYFIAGFFARVLFQRVGLAGFLRNRGRRVGLVLLAFYIPIVTLTAMPVIWAALQQGMQRPPPAQEDPLGGGIAWLHLWFLYLLLVIYALILGLRAMVVRVDGAQALRDGMTRILLWAFNSRLAAVLLAIPVILVLVTDGGWIGWLGIPVPIVGFIPPLASMVCFGGAALLGWFMHRDRQLLACVTRDAWIYLASAAVLTSVALALVGLKPVFQVMEQGLLRKVAYAFAYVGALWCWVFGLVGFAERVMTAPSSFWRYLADASYWMYLVHVPIVWFLAAWMFLWPLSWMVKFPLILAIAGVVLWASYHYLVRPTCLGEFLNGRKYPRGSVPEGDGSL